MNIVFGSIIRIVSGFYIGCTGMVLEVDTEYVSKQEPKVAMVGVELECETRDGLRAPHPRGLMFKMSEVEIIEQPKRLGVK